MDEDMHNDAHHREWRELVEAISELSEEAYDASWMKGVEYALWERVLHGPGQYGRLMVTTDHIQRLKGLAVRCGGWVRFEPNVGEVFVPLQEWEKLFFLIHQQEH